MLKKDIGEILSVRNITKKDAAWYCLVSIPNCNNKLNTRRTFMQ